MSEELTGRRRYRAKKRLLFSPLLVLQVEYKWTAEFCDERNGATWNRESLHWRDAKVEDLMMISSNIVPFKVAS